MLEQELKYGDTGNNVKILQEKLKILGYYNAVVNGSFGLSTEVGVKAFQKKYGLEETGFVNNEMWQMLISFTSKAIASDRNYPTLSLGSRGEYVKELQTKLRALLYYPYEATSIFDVETENAVKRLQYNNDVTTSGIVTSGTWDLINFLYGNLNSCVNNDNIESNDTYVVSRGDTLYSIARKFNTSVDEIKTLNNLTSNTLSIGQVLRIPGTNETTSTTTYTVTSGDTLYSIARKFNTSVDTIKTLNNLTNNTLSIGQVLRIPGASGTTPTPTTTYTVTRGDTLYSIARKFNTSVDTIKRLNNLTSNTLSIGQVLKINN